MYRNIFFLYSCTRLNPYYTLDSLLLQNTTLYPLQCLKNHRTTMLFSTSCGYFVLFHLAKYLIPNLG